MPPQRRRQLLKSIGVGSIAGLAGCTGGDDGSTTTRTTEEGGDATDGTTESSDSSDSQDDGDETHLRFVSGHATETLDPHRVGSDTTLATAVNFYDPLLYPAAETYEPSPYLAEDWTLDDDELTWEVTLRDDVTFHSGNRLTAEDVQYSIQRILALGEGVSSVWSGVLEPDGVSVADERTVTFETERKFSAFLSTLTQLFVLDSAVVKENEQDGEFGERGDYGYAYLNENVAGSGAYRLASWEKGNVLEFEAYDDYWQGWNDDRFDRASMEVVAEESTAKLTMQRGEGDITHQFLSGEAYREMDGYDNVTVQETPQLQSWSGTFNTQKPPTDDLNVRKAFAHAFDYENMLTNVFFDAEPAVGPVPVIMEAHNDELEPYRQDPEMARQALADSEYTAEEINEIGIELMYFAGYQTYRRFCLVLQQNLAEVLDITNVEVTPTQVAPLFQALQSVDSMAHVTPVANTADIPTSYNYTYLMYHPSAFPENSGAAGYGNAARWTTDELTEILEQIQTEFDRDRRLELSREAQRIIVEGYPSIFTANPKYRIAVNGNLDGWTFHGSQSFDLRWWEMSRSGDGRAE